MIYNNNSKLSSLCTFPQIVDNRGGLEKETAVQRRWHIWHSGTARGEMVVVCVVSVAREVVRRLSSGPVP